MNTTKKGEGKVKTAFLLFLVAVMIISGCNYLGNEIGSETEKVTETETIKEQMDGSEDISYRWISDRIENGGLFAFDYAGTELDKWEKDISTDASDNIVEWRLTYRSPEGIVLRCEASYQRKFSRAEWVLYFENTGKNDSPIISGIRPLHSVIGDGYGLLTTSFGSSLGASDFEPLTIDLTTEGGFSAMARNGRSSSCAWPYFMLEKENGGVIAAIGWTGEWSATFSCENGAVIGDAGMKKTEFYLKPGESVRSPSVTLMFWNGSRDDGFNKFRRMILSDYTPTDGNGKITTYLPLIMSGTNCTEAQIIDGIAKCRALGVDFETLWIDAGWYGESGKTWNEQVGNWYVNTAMFPDGNLKMISDRLADDGKELLMWFEPERARPGTFFPEKYPDYFLKTTDPSLLVYNFADSDAVDTLIEFMNDFIQENQLSWYRQDCNLDLAPIWKSADQREGENRTGISEIRYITGLYYYLDSLLETNPGLRIDNCASGGLRLDIEMMKRSVPLWRTDYTVSMNGGKSTMDEVRAIAANLSLWLPLSAGGYASEGLYDDYTWRSVLGSGAILGFYSLNDKLYLDGIKQYFMCRRYRTGDFYILSQGKGAELSRKFSVYGYDLPNSGEGMIVLFRPDGCKDMRFTVYPKWLEPDAEYRVSIYDTGESLNASGKELIENGIMIRFTTSKKRASQLLFYEKVSDAQKRKENQK